MWAALPIIAVVLYENGHIEVHIASRSSNYQQHTVETWTTFWNESDGVWSLLVP